MRKPKKWKLEPEKYMYVDDFILSYLKSIKKLQHSEPYISFALICIGIEFLGKCLDEKHDFSDFENVITSKQFYHVVNVYFKPYKYLNLYSSLRCPMLHGLIPGSGIWLKDRNGTSHTHLSKQQIHGEEKTVIIIEEFYNHFEKACMSVIQKIYRKRLKHPKMRAPFLMLKE